MSEITLQQHKDLISSLKELKSIIKDMENQSTDILLVWHKNEVNDWLNFLENHTDKEELKSLEVEIGDRFFQKYNVRIEPALLDKHRLTVFQKLIEQLNFAIR